MRKHKRSSLAMRKLENIKRKPTERISQTIFYVIIAIIAIAFALFYLVGYNTQSEEDPSFFAPLLTDVLLVLMIFLLVLAAVIGLVAVYIGLKKRDKGDKIVNGVPAAKISAITFGVTFVVMLLTFIIGSTDSLIINGHKFTDVVELKLTDMFVSTSLIMMAIAVGVMIFGYTRYIRKEK